MTAPPECAEAPKLCANALNWFDCKVCHQPTERIYEHQNSNSDRGYCAACWLSARRSQLTPTPGSGYDPAHWFDCKICDQPTERVYEHRVTGGDGLIERGFCPACYPIAARVAARDAIKSTATPSPTTCSECKAPAVLTCGMCAYCLNSLENDLLTRAKNDRRVALATEHHPRMVEPRKRLAAIEQRERTRGNAAERAMLERGHPATWPSNEGEE